MFPIRALAGPLAPAAVLAAGPAAAQETWYPSRYGPGDTLGAVNNLSPEGVRRAAALVETGKVYSLAIPTGPDSPAVGQRRYQVRIIPAPDPDAVPGNTNRFTDHDERVTTSMGVGTQMDGLGHVGIDHRYYNGLTEAQVNTPTGLKRLEMSNIPPIVTRGVLIDMARHFGKPMLEVGDVYNSADIKAAMKAQKVNIRRGDVVLFHTGWLKMIDIDKARYARSGPGLGLEGASWLADLGVVAIGSDTIALEPMPPVKGTTPGIVHQTLLPKRGVHILESINTAELAADRAHQFLLVIGQPRFVGTAQVVVNPIAIR